MILNYVKRHSPRLTAQHMMEARLFANRDDLIANLDLKQGGVVVEVGVALGDFSAVMLKTLRPSKFIAIDIFDMHKYPEHWGTPSRVLFNGMTHDDFYRTRFKKEKSVTIFKGLSVDGLEKLPDESADLIYIDAGHTYECVKEDALLSYRKLKYGGVIIFNDYILYDPFIGAQYGVVPAAHELIVDNDMRVIGLGLQEEMFCDIAVRKVLSG